MRYLPTAATAAILFAVPSQAAVVDLTYTMTLEVTKTSIYGEDMMDHLGYEYLGPEFGDIEVRTHSIRLDTDVSGAELPGGWVHSYSGFDPATGAHGYTNHRSQDEAFNLLLSSDGTGSIYEFVSYHPRVGHNAYYDVLEWSVEGLPEIAPVPLPASLPLLAVGIGAFAAIRRRQRGLSA